MKTPFYILTLLLGFADFAQANIQTKANPDKPTEVFLATANGAASFTYPPTPPLGDMPVNVSWDWNNTKGGSYTYVSLVDGQPDSLWDGYEEYDAWDTNGLKSCEVWIDKYNGGIPPNRYLISLTPLLFPGFPWEIGSLTESTTNLESLSRSSKVTIQLKTGGKTGSKLQNLFGLQANATGYRHLVLDQDDNTPEPSDSYPIAPTSIQVAGSYLDTNGITYAVFPDDATVDITPKTKENYYSVGVSAQKYHSYFEVFVNQPIPGTQKTYSDTSGHAFFRFYSSAPDDFLKSVHPELLPYKNNNWGFYPHNGALCSEPGILANDNTHGQNVSRNFYIGYPDFIAGLAFTKGLSNSRPIYCIAVEGYSCVSAAREAGQTAGVALPSDWFPQNFGADILLQFPGPPDDYTPRYAY